MVSSPILTGSKTNVMLLFLVMIPHISITSLTLVLFNSWQKMKRLGKSCPGLKTFGHQGMFIFRRAQIYFYKLMACDYHTKQALVAGRFCIMAFGTSLLYPFYSSIKDGVLSKLTAVTQYYVDTSYTEIILVETLLCF